jgi:hypothetical protein
VSRKEHKRLQERRDEVRRTEKMTGEEIKENSTAVKMNTGTDVREERRGE